MRVTSKGDIPATKETATKWSVTKGESGTFEIVDTTHDDLRDEFSDGAVYGQFDSRSEALKSFIDDMVAAKRDVQSALKAARLQLRKELKKETP